MSGGKHKLSQPNETLSDSSLSDLDTTPAKKKHSLSPKKQSSEKQKKTSTNKKEKRITTADGQQLIDLTGKKFVCVRSFKGRVFVDIREYYDDKASGELKPGKKGISLNVEQWDYLKSVMNELDEDVVNAHR